MRTFAPTVFACRRPSEKDVEHGRIHSARLTRLQTERLQPDRGTCRLVACSHIIKFPLMLFTRLAVDQKHQEQGRRHHRFSPSLVTAAVFLFTLQTPVLVDRRVPFLHILI